jgi:hypothetical protein
MPIRRAYFLELALITGIALLFVSTFAVDRVKSPPPTNVAELANIWLNPTVKQAALEHERLVGTLLPVKIGIESFGQIPTWNPYLSSGVPQINNGFNYLFNPVLSLPIILLGGVQGSKLVTILTLLIAGYSMWALGLALGFGALARVTCAALYLMNGSLIAKFAGGHFQLAASLAWPPLVIACLWWTLRSSKRFAPIATGLSFALLFYSGNIYYALHTALSGAVIVVLLVLPRFTTSWRLRRDQLKRALLAGMFAFGFSALQFFPIWETRDYVTHELQTFETDGSLQRDYTLAQAAVNLVYPWEHWYSLQAPDYSGMIGSVDYAYIGPAVFLMIGLGLAGALLSHPSLETLQKSGRGAAALAALILAPLMMVWGAGTTSVIPWLYTNISLLGEFRFVGRALAFAALWWIVLAGIGLDLFWRAAANRFGVTETASRLDSRRLVRAALLILPVWLYLLAFSFGDDFARQALALSSRSWRAALEDRIFHSLEEAISALAALVILACLLDTVWLFVQKTVYSLWGWIRRRLQQPLAASPSSQPAAMRLVRLVVLFIVAAGLLDILQVNNKVLYFEAAAFSFNPVYQALHQLDTTSPIPAIAEPFSPLAFDAYMNQVRNWALNEGWRPSTLPVLTDQKNLLDLPRWAFAYPDLYGEASDRLAQTFIETFNFSLRQCLGIELDAAPIPVDCAGGSELTAALYETSQALPYAFVVDRGRLIESPHTITPADVIPALAVEHRQDTIRIRAAAAQGAPQMLVVQETHFPGWRTAIDGVPVQAATTQTLYDGNEPKGFIAVPMLPGEHIYTLRFEPPGLTTGLLAFLLTLSGAVLYLRKQNGRPVQGPPA